MMNDNTQAILYTEKELDNISYHLLERRKEIFTSEYELEWGDALEILIEMAKNSLTAHEGESSFVITPKDVMDFLQDEDTYADFANFMHDRLLPLPTPPKGR